MAMKKKKARKAKPTKKAAKKRAVKKSSKAKPKKRVAKRSAKKRVMKKKASAKGAPAGGEQGGQNVPAKVAPAAGQTVALAPAVERKQLARTGLSPLVIALMGSFCLLGGALLFRRALAR